MTNRPIAVVMNLWAKNGTESELAETFKYMMNIVIQEPTCRLLIAERSLQDPLHYILYEELDDYDEFLEVQLKREYRGEFAARMSELRSTESQMEIFELLYRA